MIEMIAGQREGETIGLFLNTEPKATCSWGGSEVGRKEGACVAVPACCLSRTHPTLPFLLTESWCRRKYKGVLLKYSSSLLEVAMDAGLAIEMWLSGEKNPF